MRARLITARSARAARPGTARQRPRRLPIGAEPCDGGVHFRVWAPDRRRVDLVIEGGRRVVIRLRSEGDGYFAGVCEGLGAGALYRFRLDGGESFPDPASRFQPQGVDGPSQVVDATMFVWSDTEWPGVTREGQVLYEAHVGTFTSEGTFLAAMCELPRLRDLGVTTLELMPVAEFSGAFGWGYDGVFLFAPFHRYGAPDDLRALIDRAHALGLGIILDVVYNHVGPRGNVLPQYARSYFSRVHATDWGDALNFDGESSAPVRELVLANVEHWIAEYHFDGLRLDATQDLHDESPEHIVAAIARVARAAADSGAAGGRGRRVYLLAENEPQDTRLVRPRERGGHGLDAVWNDDFHHATRVAGVGRREGYYRPYRGSAQELVSSLERGFLYQGQHYVWQAKARGTRTDDLELSCFVHYLENHDQIANSLTGARGHLLSGAAAWRCLTALLLLGPQTPLLFQGQDFGASTPFPFFADHRDADLARSVREGRAAFLAQFASIAMPESRHAIPDPCSRETFLSAKLRVEERDGNREAIALHRDLLALRRSDPVWSRLRRGRFAGAVLERDAGLMRFFGDDEDDRLLLWNLGRDLAWNALPEPLLAPPSRRWWRLVWSSEHPAYGGSGTPDVLDSHGLRLPARCAVVLAPADAARGDAPGGRDRS